MATRFDKDTLPRAVASVLRMNNYDVRGPEEIHGAEIDLIAEPRADPFSAPLYIEATIEHVDNDKYGRDLTKFVLLREKDPDARLLIVSAAGFTAPVRERARKSRITTLTYDELFAKFERFDPYVQHVLNPDLGTVAGDLLRLDQVYEEPRFEDVHGQHLATQYLTDWLSEPSPQRRWIVVVGEYGTGKTALTRVLQRRWTSAYRENPAAPIPFRIELRGFTRQFDAHGLLHHFLDSNSLGHIPIEFVFSLIRSGRVVLLLDGYDEMAQYMHLRERRVCLEALAHLSTQGARGVLTSRPNYFTESEELNVYEVLYAAGDRAVTGPDRSSADLLKREREIDELITAHILERFERSLRDLTQRQTEALVRRILVGDQEGQDVILGLLDRIFRAEPTAEGKSLSGKPVIISYLLEILDSVKADREGAAAAVKSEWTIFQLIVTHLMKRDYGRSPMLAPGRRRKFLQRLAVWLSKRGHQLIEEDDFLDLIGKDFKQELARRAVEERHAEIDRLFADLRSSCTLTRAATGGASGWQFSHSSLREYLVAELLLDELHAGRFLGDALYVSDAMRAFAASQQPVEIERCLDALTRLWPHRAENHAAGEVLSLLWDAGLKVHGAAGRSDAVRLLLGGVSSGAVNLGRATLRRIAVSSESAPCTLDRADFSRATLIDVELCCATLTEASFAGAVLDNVSFRGADLRRSQFAGATLADVDLSDADLNGADFAAVTEGDISVVVDGRTHDGLLALGYIEHHGAVTSGVPRYFVCAHEPAFDIVEKICRKLIEQAKRQRRGLEQRGVANRDPDAARRFLLHLVAQELVEIDSHDLASPTEVGRNVLRRFCEEKVMDPKLASFFGR